MPRDLFSTAPREETLVASPESATPKPELSDGTESTIVAGQDGHNDFTIYRDETDPANAHRLHDGRAKETEEDNLHPYVQTLSISNLEDCVALEKAVFPENERCSREKVGVPNRVLYNSRYCAEPVVLHGSRPEMLLLRFGSICSLFLFPYVLLRTSTSASVT